MHYSVKIIAFKLDLIINQMGCNGQCFFEQVDKSNLTTQIESLHNFNPEGLVFKTVWGFVNFLLVALQFVCQVC